MTTLPSYLPTRKSSRSTATDETSTKKIEDYKPGYPQFTALISANEDYFLCRRFDKLRARLLLQKQDNLSMLEEKLEHMDSEENSPLYLGKSRCDRNTERLSLLSEVDSHLADYDQFTERTNRILSFGPARPRDVNSLQNWVESTGCLAREETMYLTHHHELVSLAPIGDSAMVQLEAWVEDKVIRFWPNFQKNCSRNISKNPNVYIYSGEGIQHTARAILLLVIILLLIGPVVICSIVTTKLGRIIIVMTSMISSILILSGLTKLKTIELILLGATYATVLIGFISSS